MKRSSFLVSGVSAAGLTFLPHVVGAQSDLTAQTPTGTLAGTLQIPAATAGPPPVVLIVSGSGPTDRDGNAPGAPFNTNKLLAAALAQRGIASLRYDKRTVGASMPNWSERDLTVNLEADDAAAWIRALRQQKRFSRVTIAGHSEGSLIGMLAAQREPVEGFVSLEGAGHNIAMLLKEQLRGRLGPYEAQSDAIIASLSARRTVADVPAALMPLYRPSLQPYLISWLEYDPAAEIKNVQGHIAIVQGTADIQVPQTEGAALHAAVPSAAYVVVEGMNHVLKHAPDTSSAAAIQTGYVNPALPIEPAVVDAVATVALGT